MVHTYGSQMHGLKMLLAGEADYWLPVPKDKMDLVLEELRHASRKAKSLDQFEQRVGFAWTPDQKLKSVMV